MTYHLLLGRELEWRADVSAKLENFAMNVSH